MSEARKNLFPLLEQVNEDRTPVEITSKRGDVVLIGIDDYRALDEQHRLVHLVEGDDIVILQARYHYG